MGSSVRKLARKKYKFAKKEAEDALSAKLNKFDRLSDKCLICDKVFDKRSKEMVQSWSVVVDTDKINLYCPTCWKRANTVIDAIKEAAIEQE